jgi:DNA-binding SARP family transcriptional activator
MVLFGVLGPVRADTARGPVALKGPRHRAVLARLLIARGRVVPVDLLVDDLWERPPEGAVAAIRTFVSDLRRALEPDRLPRQPAALLVTAPPGYALTAAPDAVDAWRFEAAVTTPGATLAGLDAALALWRGPAYAEYADQGWARAEIDRLDGLRLLAVERRAEALLTLGRAADAASDLQAHATTHPLREDAWQLLATALYRAGRQGEALAALRQIRSRLADELGVDPGPRLRQLETDILTQAPHLTLPSTPTPISPNPATAAPISPLNPAGSGPSHSRGSTAVSGPSPAADASCGNAMSRPGGTPELVGRDAELAQLLDAAAEVAGQGGPALALISGEAGAGKTALVEELTHRLTTQGWTAIWGHGPGYEGAAVTWPTAGTGGDQTTRHDASAAGSGVAGRDGEGAGSQAVEDPAVARFRRRRAAVARLSAPAGRGPVLLVADDLHLADEATLELVAALAVEPVPVFVVGTFRATEIGPALTAALARFARVEPVRVYLGGLDVGASGALARTVTGFDLDLRTARLIQRRSGGNPFFVRELARLLAAEGGAALERVPAGVRDIIRHRLERLAEPVRTVLRQAAVLGRDIDPDLLAALAGDEAAMLDALDAALRAGLLDEDGPGGQPRFSHVLVRDTIYADLSALRRGRWHAVAGEALERRPQRDVAALAHHFARAAGPGTADRAARYSAAAAKQAERESRPHEAARLWHQALNAHDQAADTGTDAGAGARERLAAVMGLGRALAITGHLDQARRHRAEALAAVRRLDDPELTANVIAAFAVPAVWTRNDDEQLSAEIVRTAERALATLGPDRPEQRSRLLSTIALELRGTTTDRGDRAAREAEALARRTGDPALLAFALNARFMHTFGRTGLARERAAIGAELVAVAARHDLVTFEVLGHLVLVQAHSALGEPADADAEAADRLAERYDLPLVGVLTQWYAALRLALDARAEEAEAAYRAAHLRLSASGMPGMADGLLGLALLSVAADGWRDADFGPYRPWAEPLILLAAGQRERATAALRALPPSPHDLLREARLCLTVRAARALGDEKTLARVREELRPAAAELAGAGSGAITLGRVADYL